MGVLQDRLVPVPDRSGDDTIDPVTGLPVTTLVPVTVARRSPRVARAGRRGSSAVCAGRHPCGAPHACGVASDFGVGRYRCSVFQQSVRSRCSAQLAPLSHPSLLTLAVSFASVATGGDKELQQLFIAEPYLELHEGPGRGYAVTQVVPRGDAIDVLYRRTEWFRVRTQRGVEGWAYQRDMHQDPAGRRQRLFRSIWATVPVTPLTNGNWAYWAATTAALR